MGGETCGTCGQWFKDPIESEACDVPYGACHASLSGGRYKLTAWDSECIEPDYYYPHPNRREPADKHRRLAQRLTGKLCRMCRACYVPHCEECEVKRIKKREGWRA